MSWLQGLGAGLTSAGQSFMQWGQMKKEDEATQLARLAAGLRTQKDIAPDVLGKMEATPVPSPGIAMPGGATASIGQPPPPKKPSATDVQPQSFTAPGGEVVQTGPDQVSQASGFGSLPAAASSPAELAKLAATPSTQQVQDRYERLGDVGGDTWYYDAEGSVSGIQARKDAAERMQQERELLGYQDTLARARTRDEHLDPAHQRGHFTLGQQHGKIAADATFEEGTDYDWVQPSLAHDSDMARAAAMAAQANAANIRAVRPDNAAEAVRLDQQKFEAVMELMRASMLNNYPAWQGDPQFVEREMARIEAEVERRFGPATEAVYGGGPGVARGGGGVGQDTVVIPFQLQTRFDNMVRAGADANALRARFQAEPESTWVDQYIREKGLDTGPSGQ